MKLPILTIAEPCSQDWNAMTGDERTRHCEHCATSVTDLSTFTDDEVRQALASPDRPRCVRFLRAPDGAVVTRTDQRQRLTAMLRALADRKPSGQ